MGLYLAAKIERKNTATSTLVTYAPMDLFKSLDSHMFCPEDRPIIQLNSTLRELCNELGISYDLKHRMSMPVTNGDAFKIYKKASQILATWTPNLENEDEKRKHIHLNWVSGFIEVCLENELQVYME